MTTLEELAVQHNEYYVTRTNVLNEESTLHCFTIDQLRVLITEAVGIVAGEPVAYHDDAEGLHYENWMEGIPLHAIDLGRLG